MVVVFSQPFSTLPFLKRTSTPLLRSFRPNRIKPPVPARTFHNARRCSDISPANPSLRGPSGSMSVMNGVSQHPRLDKPMLSALETDPLDIPPAPVDPEHHKPSCISGYHSSNSDSSSSPSSTCTPPVNYRRTVHTIIDQVDTDAIQFTPSSKPGEHPYEDPSLRIYNDETRIALESAARLLKRAQPVAFPTETVYGLGADATSTDAVKSIYTAKSRPADNPLIVHVASLKQLRRLLPRPYTAARLPFPVSAPQKEDTIDEETIPQVYLPLIERFWPGPLTILLPLPNPSPLSPRVTSTQPTFAARMPRHPIALALAAISDLPLAAPSANASGRPSPTTAQHVFADLNGKIPLIIDGGSADVGLESTVVDGLHNPPVILRPGGISAEEIRQCGGVWKNVVVAKRDEESDMAPRAPGMKYKHYSPRAGVILYDVGANAPSGRDLFGSSKSNYICRVGVVRTRTWKEGFVHDELRKWHSAHGPGDQPIEIFERSLGSNGKDISRGLFSVLRELDEVGVDVIYVEGIEEADEGLAVMNRLGKAASVVVRKVDDV